MSKKLKTAIVIAILTFLAFIDFYVLIPQESSLFQITDDLSLAMAIIAGLSMLLTFKLLGWKPMEGRVWFFLSIGFFIWILGEFIWLYIKPVALLVNTFFLIGFIFIILGLWIELKITKATIQKKDIIKSLILTIPISAISAYFVILPTILSITYNLQSKVLYLSLHFGDLISIFFALTFFFVFKGAKMAKSWLMITMALLLGTIASISSLSLNWSNLYSGMPLVLTQLAWIMDYILLTFAAYYHRLILRLEI